VNNDELNGPTHLAATTLLSMCMLYDDVHTPDDVIGRASDILADSFMDVALIALQREGVPDE